MKKKGAEKVEIPPLNMPQEYVQTYAEIYTTFKNPERSELQYSIEAHNSAIADYNEELERLEAHVQDYRESLDMRTEEREEAQKKLAELPVVAPMTEEEARESLARALALPFVKRIQEYYSGGIKYLVITTRENALFTTLTRKYSKNERWYTVKPYRIPLPAYTIRFALRPFNTLANSDGMLSLTLANQEEDTAHFLHHIHYSHQPHAHWATRGIGRSPSGVCLGEYESEVSRAFRTGLAEGLSALAVFLQTSGATNGYIHTRHEWALWLGKKVYNALVMPSSVSKDIEDAVSDEDMHDGDEVDNDESHDHDTCEECGGCLTCEECGCE